ncbi:hypothetical protein CBW24_11710 [Pacificitalea manganoxidans]|uniref:Uncharacterized protein n=1 Tax=Pacificitalea manganoxidans TaxID=1411902 RepID=A0A291M1J4_9RHOB|nr:hypothetical protein [Pacificitalea manganoxidans]ATI42605.1 hypothetical protein CBW24_11710 [Pacificitalea manganoxidans]MBF52982.1 hypothetical protein [Actibacterium sp.]MDR6307520.1 hypothetical protein [Pacificitalea manganoxidans]OWU67276.1 hypothetical protein ATO2_15520 [Roseovarius sp. 22II1-1F6A]|tara:strand:+ start:1782 stop:1976 length:195 start_codon:yes stop_codon:yes gene_type:complete
MARLAKPALAFLALASLAACGDTVLERAGTGAAAGALIADATDNDVATGAAVGAGVGAVTTPRY